MSKNVKLNIKALKTATTRGICSALGRFGSYTRRSARSSIRKRKKISAPGAPPSSHTDALRAGIMYAVDREKLTVVVGVPKGKSSAPAVLEHGGIGKDGKFYRARPFMAPAFEQQKKNITKLFKNCIVRKSNELHF